LTAVVSAWALLASLSAAAGGALEAVSPRWPLAFGAAALWGLNLLILLYGVGSPFSLTRIPILAAGFGLLMTVLGTGSYWATTVLFPGYEVNIERAMLLVALCTSVTLTSLVVCLRVLERIPHASGAHIEWDWERLRVVTYLVTAAAAIGTLESLRRIGYIPILSGDPASVRFDFPMIGGIWYRLSVMGGVGALLAAAQVASRQARLGVYAAGLACLLMVSAYGARFLVALPVGVALLLWDRFRARLPVVRTALMLALVMPIVPLLGYLRQGFPLSRALGPGGLFFFNTFLEFRDLGWAMDFFGDGNRLVHGSTLGSVLVPLLPAPLWTLVGIDKAALYSRDSATLVADAMGQTTGQRIGAYGEFFMNYGWPGALLGAALYGVLLAYLDWRFRHSTPGQVRSLLLGLTAAAAIFAQIGQLNMFTSTLTGLGYPVLLVALFVARRPSE